MLSEIPKLIIHLSPSTINNHYLKSCQNPDNSFIDSSKKQKSTFLRKQDSPKLLNAPQITLKTSTKSNFKFVEHAHIYSNKFLEWTNRTNA